MIFRYIQQAMYMLELGVDHKKIDDVLYQFGFPMGPFVMADMSGLDIFKFASDVGLPAVELLCEKKRLGMKSAMGFYRYKQGSHKPIYDPETSDILSEIIKRDHEGELLYQFSDLEILKRCIYALINEGVNILAEKIAQRGSDIDVIYVYGFGFPPYRGGPMLYADSVGLEEIYQDILAFKAQDASFGDDQWQISPLWQELINGNKKLSRYIV